MAINELFYCGMCLKVKCMRFLFVALKFETLFCRVKVLILHVFKIRLMADEFFIQNLVSFFVLILQHCKNKVINTNSSWIAGC